MATCIPGISRRALTARVGLALTRYILGNELLRMQPAAGKDRMVAEGASGGMSRFVDKRIEQRRQAGVYRAIDPDKGR